VGLPLGIGSPWENQVDHVRAGLEEGTYNSRGTCCQVKPTFGLSACGGTKQNGDETKMTLVLMVELHPFRGIQPSWQSVFRQLRPAQNIISSDLSTSNLGDLYPHGSIHSKPMVVI